MLKCLDYLETTFDSSFSSGDFTDVNQKKQEDRNKRLEQDSHPEVEATALQDHSQSLFSCPNEGCIKVYQRHSDVEKHLTFGKCQLHLEKETLLDKAKTLYQEKLLEGTSSSTTIQAELTSRKSEKPLLEGWALRSSKKGNRFSNTQIRYLEDKFVIGQQTGHKQDLEVVARDMRFARNSEGTRLFTVTEFLSARQIQAFFSRRAAKLRQVQSEADLENQDDDIAAAEEQQAYENVRTLVLNEVQLRHPIVFDVYNLCEMNKATKINKLSVAMLRSICEHFDLNIEHITSRLKAPYIAKLVELVKTCECCT